MSPGGTSPEASKCDSRDTPERKEKEAKALQALKELGARISMFSDSCYEAYQNKYSMLEKEYKNWNSYIIFIGKIGGNKGRVKKENRDSDRFWR